jgi:hypothetical protein
MLVSNAAVSGPREDRARATQDVVTGAESTRGDAKEIPVFVPSWLVIPEENVANMWPTLKRRMPEETSLPPKYEELIALVAAANFKYPYCQYFHRGVGRMHRTTSELLVEGCIPRRPHPRHSSMIHAGGYDLKTFRR